MDPRDIIQVKELAAPIVDKEGLFLVDIEEKGGDETVLWIYVDSEAGDINIEACQRISRELEFVLDAHNLIRSRYRLNVSSPGLSRPLTDRRQYGKNRGRKVRVKYKSEEEQYEKVEGDLKEVSGQEIVVAVEDDAKTIPFESIVETKVIPKI